MPIESNPQRRFRLLARLAAPAAALAMLCGPAGPGPAMAAQPVQTFGPGKVSCQRLSGNQSDCLLSASRITSYGPNEASFAITDLPAAERALFSKWCLHDTDYCIVTIKGQKQSPQTTRLSSVQSLHWTRSDAPLNQAAARALGQ